MDLTEQAVFYGNALRSLNLGEPMSRGRGRGRGRGRRRAGGYRASQSQGHKKKEYDEEVSEELLEPLKVFVGSLRREVTDYDLKEALQQYANIKKVTIIKEKFTRASKGYGFVVVHSKEDVDKLLSLKDGDLYLHGRPMAIKRARKQILQPGHYGYERADLPDRPYDLSPPDPDRPSAHILVDDVLVKIISYLPIDQRIRIERVCRRWQALVHHSFAPMTSLEIRRGMMGLSRPLEWPIVSKLLVLTGPSLKVLKIYDMNHLVRNNLLRSIGQLCPNLDHIELGCVRGITSNSLEEFSRYCPNLKSFINRGSPDFTEKSLQTLLTHFRSLECLDLALCLYPTGNAFVHLPSTLKELHLLGTRIKPENMHHIPSQCPNLEVLDIWEHDCPALFYKELKENCTKLKTLHVEVFVESFLPSIAAIKSLTTLRIQGCGISVDMLVEELPLLECLDIENMTVKPTTDFSKLKNLKKLSISHCTVVMLKETIMSITKCTKLEEVSFRRLALETVIPKNFLTELVKNCLSLNVVDIDLTDIDMADLKKLKELVKNRTEKLVIISKNIPKEVLEGEYDGKKLELLCRYATSEYSDCTGSDYIPHDLDSPNDSDLLDDDFFDEDLFIHWNYWYNDMDIWEDL